MSILQFAFAILGILLTPGPSNTLLALAGTSHGVRHSLPLVGMEITAYCLVVFPLALFGPTLMSSPVVALLLKTVASMWVMYLAIKLWRVPVGTAARGAVTRRQVFLTTLMNPKALIFGLVLLPAVSSVGFVPRFSLFCLSVVCTGMLWTWIGATINRNKSKDSARLVFRRIAAGWLAIVSLGLAGDVLASAF